MLAPACDRARGGLCYVVLLFDDSRLVEQVARAFVQEWRGLTPRKRDVLKKHPCRPPLAEELRMLTPALIGRQAQPILPTYKLPNSSGGVVSL